jgi:hypothetical protein
MGNDPVRLFISYNNLRPDSSLDQHTSRLDTLRVIHLEEADRYPAFRCLAHNPPIIDLKIGVPLL